METETIEERFGFIAEKKEFITMPQLLEALEIQVKENLWKGQHRFIGDILHGLGYITDIQIDHVLEPVNTSN